MKIHMKSYLLGSFYTTIIFTTILMVVWDHIIASSLCLGYMLGMFFYLSLVEIPIKSAENKTN